MMHDEFDTDTDNMEQPTGRDIFTWTLYVVIGAVLLGYVALWRVGII